MLSSFRCIRSDEEVGCVGGMMQGVGGGGGGVTINVAKSGIMLI